MKSIIAILCCLVYINSSSAQTTLETFHDFSAITINGDTLDFATLAGKKVLVVNTASFCAYTPQYAELEQLFQLYGDSTFTILGFPCNDFGGQEPGDETQIDSFCTNTYGVTFQMMKKISITAVDTAEVYKWLQLQSRNGVMDAPVLWNFYKFMIDEAGNWHDYKPSAVSPLDTSIVNWILSPSVLQVSENNPDLNVDVFPNPANDLLHISMSANSRAHISLVGIDGRLYSKFEADAVNINNRMSMPTTKLANGIYFVKIELHSATICKKVIINHSN